MKKTAIAFAFAGAMLASAPAVYAVPIATGSQISFTGGVQAINKNDPTDQKVLDATGLDFANFGVFKTAGGTINLNSNGTGSFSIFTAAGCPMSANMGGCGTIQDIQDFATFKPLSPFYTITEGTNTLTFNLNALTAVKTDPDTDTLSIAGTGTFILAGFDPTPGRFVLSAQGSGGTTFSATTTGQAVPEPATIALIGAGLVATGLVRRRRSI